MAIIKKFISTLRNRLPRIDVAFWTKKIHESLIEFRPGSAQKNQYWFTPLVFIVACLWTIVTVGVAFGAFFTLFLCLLLLYFIFTRIFGFELRENEVVVM